MTFLIHVYLLADLSLVFFINLYNSQLFSSCLNLIHYMPFANSSTGNLFKLLSLYKCLSFQAEVIGLKVILTGEPSGLLRSKITS